MIDTEEPVGQEVYRMAMEDLLASAGWDYLFKRLLKLREESMGNLTRLSQDYQARPTEIAAVGSRIRMIDQMVKLPSDMAKETYESSPLTYNHAATRGRRNLSGR